MHLAADPTMVPHLKTPVPGSRPFTCADMTEWVRSGKRLMYLRFSDGEMHSMFGTSGRGRRNADGHLWMTDTMGRELRETLVGAMDYASTGGGMRVEIPPCWSEWLAMRRFIQGLDDNQRACIVPHQLWVQAVRGGDLFAFMDALVDTPCPKVLVAKGDCEPVADAIGARLVAAPYPDAYAAINEITSAVQALNPGLVLSSIGMGTECLLWRLRHRVAVAIDFGHVPDALMGRAHRRYLKRPRRAMKTARRFKAWGARNV